MSDVERPADVPLLTIKATEQDGSASSYHAGPIPTLAAFLCPGVRYPYLAKANPGLTLN